jgi:hypothetical protein
MGWKPMHICAQGGVPFALRATKLDLDDTSPTFNGEHWEYFGRF